MAVGAPSEAPTREDAERAAQALIAAGVDEVLLVGSVARGSAGPYSDIDLVAIYADLDYTERFERRTALETAAQRAAGRPVQVHVTDQPEWQARVERVPTSFEARLAADAVPAGVASERAAVDWGKELVRPLDDHAEALHHFANGVLPELHAVEAYATMTSPFESDPHGPEDRKWALHHRMVSLCAAAARTAGLALGALAVLYGVTPTHKKAVGEPAEVLGEFLARVPEPARSEATAVFDRCGIELAVLSVWYCRDPADGFDDLRSEADRLASTYAVMAAEVAGVLTAHLQQELTPAEAGAVDGYGDLTDIADEQERIAARLAASEVRLGSDS